MSVVRVIQSWLLRGLALFVLVVLVYGLLGSEHSIGVYQQEQRSLQAMQKRLQALQQQHEHLARMIVGVRDNRQVQEDLVRKRLGFVYPDEYIWMVPDQRRQTEELK